MVDLMFILAASSACGGSSGGTTAAPAPTPAPTTAAPTTAARTTAAPTTAVPTTASCTGNLNWIGDKYCDDELNNVQCEFDKGDCCNNSMSGWDNYCTVSTVF